MIQPVASVAKKPAPFLERVTRTLSNAAFLLADVDIPNKECCTVNISVSREHELNLNINFFMSGTNDCHIGKTTVPLSTLYTIPIVKGMATSNKIASSRPRNVTCPLINSNSTIYALAQKR